jgi:hypothetical protein
MNTITNTDFIRRTLERRLAIAEKSAIDLSAIQSCRRILARVAETNQPKG